MNLQTKSIYEAPSREDGKRLLVEFFWPRGVWKQRADLEGWLREMAPSKELTRQWQENRIDFATFKAAYMAELSQDPKRQQAVENLHKLTRKHFITLLYANGSEEENSALVLAHYLAAQNENA